MRILPASSLVLERTVRPAGIAGVPTQPANPLAVTLWQLTRAPSTRSPPGMTKSFVDATAMVSEPALVSPTVVVVGVGVDLFDRQLHPFDEAQIRVRRPDDGDGEPVGQPRFADARALVLGRLVVHPAEDQAPCHDEQYVEFNQ